MENGKLSERILKRSVLRQFHNDNLENKMRSAAVGNDCAFLCSEGGLETAVNTQTVCFGGSKAGFYAVMQAVNHLAAAGAVPVAISDNITMPADTDEAQLKEVVAGIKKAVSYTNAAIRGQNKERDSKELQNKEQNNKEQNNIEQKDNDDGSIESVDSRLGVICGHTEISSAVSAPVVSVTAFGKDMKGILFARSEEDNMQSKASGQTGTYIKKTEVKMRPGQQIVISKYIGLEGTAILAQKYRDRLREKLPAKMIDEAAGYEEMISVLPEAAGASKSGVCAMHALSQGGVFGALWEMAEAAGTGLSINLKAIPVRQETIEICEQLELNPYRLLSGGSLLMAADDGEALAESLIQSGIPAFVIGCATEGNDRVLVGSEEGERRFLEPVNQEELFGAL